MSEWKATAILIGLFALRCILPLVFTIVIAMLMNRMLDRWEVQEAEKKAAAARATASPAALPSHGKRPSLACWVLRNCESCSCPAYHNMSAPCWQLRSAAEGHLPSECADCEMYTGAVVVA